MTEPRVCIATEKRHAYSETFLEAEIREFQRSGVVLHGSASWFPTHRDGKRLLPKSLVVPLSKKHALPRFVGRVLGWIATFLLRRELVRQRVDVVLAQYGPVGTAMIAACEKAQIPLIVRFYGFDAYQKDLLTQHLNEYQNVFSKAALLLAVSDHMAHQLVCLGAPVEKVRHLPLGADTRRFTGARPGEAPPRLLSVGRLVAKKAPYLTILAFREVFAAVPDATLTLVGDGPLREVCERLIAALGLEERVDMMGVVPHEQVVGLMRKARVYVQHSVTAYDGDSEGTPVAVLEAASAGLPVVATRHMGIAESVLHAKTGFLVAENDVSAMSDHLIRLCADPALAAAMGEAGAARVREKFSLEGSLRQLKEVIREVVSLEDQDHNDQ